MTPVIFPRLDWDWGYNMQCYLMGREDLRPREPTGRIHVLFPLLKLMIEMRRTWTSYVVSSGLLTEKMQVEVLFYQLVNVSSLHDKPCERSRTTDRVWMCGLNCSFLSMVSLNFEILSWTFLYPATTCRDTRSSQSNAQKYNSMFIPSLWFCLTLIYEHTVPYKERESEKQRERERESE